MFNQFSTPEICCGFDHRCFNAVRLWGAKFVWLCTFFLISSEFHIFLLIFTYETNSAVVMVSSFKLSFGFLSFISVLLPQIAHHFLKIFLRLQLILSIKWPLFGRFDPFFLRKPIILNQPSLPHLNHLNSLIKLILLSASLFYDTVQLFLDVLHYSLDFLSVFGPLLVLV